MLKADLRKKIIVASTALASCTIAAYFMGGTQIFATDAPIGLPGDEYVTYQENSDYHHNGKWDANDEGEDSFKMHFTDTYEKEEGVYYSPDWVFEKSYGRGVSSIDDIDTDENHGDVLHADLAMPYVRYNRAEVDCTGLSKDKIAEKVKSEIELRVFNVWNYEDEVYPDRFTLSAPKTIKEGVNTFTATGCYEESDTVFGSNDVYYVMGSTDIDVILTNVTDETTEEPKITVEIPMGYITFDEYGHIDKSSITVKANGEVLSEDDYRCDDGRDSDGATKSFSVLVRYNGKDYLVSVNNASTSYDLNNYQLANVPESITAKNKKDEESIKNALKNVVFQNRYSTLERGDKTYAIVISDIEDTVVRIRLVGHTGYSFGGEIYKYISIPITFTDTEEQNTSTEEGEESGNENNEEIEPSEPATEPSPEPEPEPESESESEPTQPAIPEKENRLTIEANGMGYHATVSMNNPIPYAKNKKVLARSLDVKCTVMDADGNSTGIYVKSVKATKAKNGFTKATIKLKGRTKLEKKAVKQMNKSLKKILVEVSS